MSVHNPFEAALLRILSELSVDDVKEHLRRQAGNKGDSSLFHHYVDGAGWKSVEMNEEDFQRLRLIDSPMWNRLSNGSRDPIAVAKKLKTGNLAADESETMKEVLRISGEPDRLEQPIFVKEVEGGEWLVFDGCTRCVSRALTKLQSGTPIQPFQAYFGPSRS